MTAKLQIRIDAPGVHPESVDIEALEKKNPDYVAFWDAMLENKRTIIVATPSIAEFNRKNIEPIPSSRHILNGPFDKTAAEILAARFPSHVFQEFKAEGFSAGYIKYDALIAACALRYRAEVLVTSDKKHGNLARKVSLRVAVAADFRAKQTVLAEGPLWSPSDKVSPDEKK